MPGAATVEEALRAAGLSRGGRDRLSTPADARLVRGLRVTLDRGVPVTLVDGGRASLVRSPRGTVAEALAAEGVALGPLDEVTPDPSAVIRAGDTVRITRVSEVEETVRESVPFPVRRVDDATLDRGREVVATAGQAGEIVNTYRVRIVDGAPAARTLIGSERVLEPVEEVRRVGTKVAPAAVTAAVAGYSAAPAAGGDIESIIRAAAAAQGANADQLVRVAWCESRFNPNALNPSSGAAGLFQFLPSTWAANSVRAGYAGASVFDPVASANVAAWMFARGQAGQWVCK